MDTFGILLKNYTIIAFLYTEHTNDARVLLFAQLVDNFLVYLLKVFLLLFRKSVCNKIIEHKIN